MRLNEISASIIIVLGEILKNDKSIFDSLINSVVIFPENPDMAKRI